MADPQTNTDAQGTNDVGANNTGAQGTDPSTNAGAQASGDTAGAQSPAAPRTLEKVYEDYEAALGDFNTKLDQSNAATDATKTAAQTVAGLKQELEALEADVTSSFDKVQTFLASAS